MLFSLYDWAVWKKVMAELGTPLDELEETLVGYGARENPKVIHYTINWYRYDIVLMQF